MDLSKEAKRLLDELVPQATNRIDNEGIYRTTIKGTDAKKPLIDELVEKEFIEFIDYSGLFKVHCKVTEKAFKYYGIEVF